MTEDEKKSTQMQREKCIIYYSRSAYKSGTKYELSVNRKITKEIQSQSTYKKMLDLTRESRNIKRLVIPRDEEATFMLLTDAKWIKPGGQLDLVRPSL